MIGFLYIASTVISFMIIFMYVCYRNEKSQWNNGHCPRCHSLWESFDMDSSGATEYKCQCGNYIWLGFNFKGARNTHGR